MILTFQQQQAYKAISANNEKRFPQLLEEVENCELRELLGIALIQDLQSNPNTTYNKLLLNGDSFIYCGNTISHKGIRYITAYMVYSKYVGESYITDTFSGFVKKKTEQSDPITEGEVRRLQENARKIALSEFEIVKSYLDVNYQNFPKWNCEETKKIYTPRFYTVRKTNK